MRAARRDKPWLRRRGTRSRRRTFFFIPGEHSLFLYLCRVGSRAHA
ncbi:hypothetical protein CAter282_3961 [Collimonas arenae]|uniref:Uncharacterized protein n=1 Tax=Collimonas arenae TaxID=279058 RepID=A0A127PVH5_9BURK|nr:hypothetical protein CAter10_4317 [Collimonas arenae]AMP11630.1 hypothetical protein CAter282_3961 [Collimonas arenae]